MAIVDKSNKKGIPIKICETISHELLHLILCKEHGERVCGMLDNLCTSPNTIKLSGID